MKKKMITTWGTTFLKFEGRTESFKAVWSGKELRMRMMVE